MTHDEARDRVAKGAALLDVRAPGWADRIDVGTLNMGSRCLCVLGQLYGEYGDAVDELWPDDVGHLTFRGARHGFDICGADCWTHGISRENYRRLQDEWIREICSRRVLAAPLVADVVAVRA